MGFGAFLVLCIVVVALAAIACLVLDSFFPNHPQIINKVIWGVVLLIIIYVLAQATGILGRDVAIPKLR